jgi:hypothetical protein
MERGCPIVRIEVVRWEYVVRVAVAVRVRKKHSWMLVSLFGKLERGEEGLRLRG